MINLQRGRRIDEFRYKWWAINLLAVANGNEPNVVLNSPTETNLASLIIHNNIMYNNRIKFMDDGDSK